MYFLSAYFCVVYIFIFDKKYSWTIIDLTLSHFELK